MSTEQWTPGTKLWWNTTGYGYKGRIPCELVSWSASRKRAYIRVRARDYFGQYIGQMSTHASPAKLGLRHD